MELAVSRKGGSGNTELAARSRFRKFDPEKEQTVRKADVKENEVIEQLKTAWKKYSLAKSERLDNYGNAVEIVSGLEYSAEDIENFSITMSEFQDEKDFSYKAGIFLSTLINNCKDSDYIVHTAHLSVNIDVIGFRNTKNIVIKGNVYSVGPKMNDGSIIVEGNADAYVGYSMKGGSIVIRGNIGLHVGSLMEGGSITVEGDVGGAVGQEMKGGEIHLLGDYESISDDIYGGKIYHKEKLIRPSLWRRFLDWIKSK